MTFWEETTQTDKAAHMNRLKKEEKLKQKIKYLGLTKVEIEKLKDEEAKQQKIEELARKIHLEKFPEEYDSFYDSSIEAKNRKNGINPMSEKYINEVNIRRTNLGVAPLSDAGLPVSDETMTLCLNEAKNILNNTD